MKLKQFTFNPWQVNTYILYDETKEAIIVDPGCSDDREKNTLKKFIEDEELKPVKLINTHSHIDHIMGNSFVNEEYGLKPIGHREDVFLVEKFSEQAMMMGIDIDGNPPSIEENIQEGDIIGFGNTELKILEVPGHSPGSIVLVCEAAEIAIVGDVIFYEGIGRTDLWQGDYSTLIQGIKTKILTLDKSFALYPGHGPSTSVGHELVNNPFF